MEYFNKIAEPDFQVHIDTEYSVSCSSEDHVALANVRSMGDLSREDYLQGTSSGPPEKRIQLN